MIGDTGRQRGERALSGLEAAYLLALRVILLLLATGLIAYAAWQMASGLYKLSGDVETVVERPSVVTPAEVAEIASTARPAAGNGAARPADPTAAYRAFVERYYRLYLTAFDPFRRNEDSRLSREAFDRRFVASGDRVEQVAAGRLVAANDLKDLETLQSVMRQASRTEAVRTALRRYRTARRETVSRTVSGTRTERYCSYYGYYIDACISYDTREVPFRRRVTETRLPAGVASPADQFQTMQDRYLTLLGERRRDAASQAAMERAAIEDANAEGARRLWSSTWLAGGFLLVMLVFLAIAMERHQRAIARSLDSAHVPPPDQED